MASLDYTGVTDLVTYLRSKFATLVGGFVTVSQGGTGKGTHTANAVLTGNGTGAVNNVSTADGALYATAANGAAQFGTLPVAQGGTAGTTEAEARASLEVPKDSSIAYVESTTATANHAVGDTFMFNGNLVQAAVAIAAGETITAAKVTQITMSDKVLSVWNNAILYRGAVVEDFNDYKQAGVYSYGGSSTDGVANKPNPSGGFTGILIVYPNTLSGTTPGIVLQLYFSTTLTAFFRVYGSSSGWTAWKQLTTA